MKILINLVESMKVLNILFSVLVVVGQAAYAEPRIDARLQYAFYAYNYNSNDLHAGGSESPVDHQVDLRLMMDVQADYSFSIHDQIQGVKSERLTSSVPVQLLFLNQAAQLNDQSRLLDLSHTLHEGEEHVAIHRLDRLNIGYTTEYVSWKLGRYAVSWGNGVVYSVMDVFNPFDPASIDKEYKTGDDMLYMQYLFLSGNDLQLLVIPRRDTQSRSVSSEVSSVALKYHGLFYLNDYDLLLARHYDETLLGAGLSYDLHGLLWRGDLLFTETDEQVIASLLTSLTYAWSLNEKPVTGFMEFYYAEYGESFNGEYRIADITNNSTLVERLQRGEVYTIGRRYLAIGGDFEWHPLVHLMPTIFYNVDDQSSLLQVILRYEFEQDLVLQLGVQLAQGASGTEYGGIQIESSAGSLSPGDSLFVQANAYF